MREPSQAERLHARAAAYWRPLADSLSLSDTVYAQLVAAYEEPHRRYHSLEHIVEMLDCLTQSRHVAKEPDAAALAISDEPAGGSLAPTTTPIWVGPLG